MTELLFAYGTLKDPDVQRKIVGRELVGESDVLEGYATEQVDIEGVYPTLIETAGASVSGLVLNILADDFPALDGYEGKGWEKMKVQLKSGKETWAYKYNKLT